jgi:hypothetical protein
VRCMPQPRARIRKSRRLSRAASTCICAIIVCIWIWILDFGLLCDVPIGAHFNTSHDKAHCALSRVGAGLRRY